MSNRVSDKLLSKLSEFVAAQMGLHFPKGRWRDLERGITAAAREFDFQDTESCARWLLSSALSRSQVETLASHLTIGETYFFREKRTFEILEQHVLPELIRSRGEAGRRLRIWSAGCSTGEEPYSIAILLSKMIPNLQDWHITILATDLNSGSLQKASEGIYSEWSFRDTPLWVKERYFDKTKDGRSKILPSIKKMLTLSHLNLAVDCYPSLLNNTNAIDLILCRNVLIYFAPGETKKVIRSLYNSLVDDGWLIVSPTETSHILFSEFRTMNFPGVILYKKDEASKAGENIVPMDSSDYLRCEKVNVPIEPYFDFCIKSDSEITLIEDSQAPFAFETEGQKRAEPPLTSYLEALALYQQGLYRDAEEKLLGLHSQGHDDTRAMALLAKICANQAKLAEALEWCRKAIATEKLNPSHRFLLATILQEQGQIEEAIRALRQAIYIDPKFVLAHVALGHLTLRQGKLTESKKHFENVLSLLSDYRRDVIVPESEGMTAGRLIETIASVMP